jgi:hypothetical protein
MQGTHNKIEASSKKYVELTRLKQHSRGLKKSTPWLTHSTWKRVFLSPQRSSLLIVVSRTKRTSEIELKFLSCSSLPRQKKRFRVSALPAQLERAKVFVPRSLGYIWLRLYPNSQLIEILQTDLAVMHTLYQVGTNRRR